MLSGIKKRDFDNLQLMHLWMPVCMNYIHVLEIQLVCKWVIKKGINLDNTKLYLIPETWCCIDDILDPKLEVVDLREDACSLKIDFLL